jgi:hypothetical protein
VAREPSSDNRPRRPLGSTTQPPSLIGDVDLVQFAAGTHLQVYQKLGAQPAVLDGGRGHLLRYLGT